MGRASLPPQGWQPGDEASGAEALWIRLELEDDPRFVFDLRRYPGPTRLRQEMCQAVAIWSTSSHGVRRASSVENVKRSCALFLRWVATLTDEQGDSLVSSAKDLTPFHLVQFREFAETTLSSGSFQGYYGRACMLMDFLPTSPAVRLQARKRRASKTFVPVKSFERYEEHDFLALQRTARNVVRVAHRRVTAALDDAMRGAERSASAKQRALWEVLHFGEPQSLDHWKALDAWTDGARHKRKARSLLFVDSSENMAAAVLIACRNGMNLSAVSSMTEPILMAHAISQSDVDKPRRGPRSRFWAEIVDDRGEDKGAAATVRLVAEMTASIREYLRIQGTPTDRLLLHWGNTPEPRLGAANRADVEWARTLAAGVSFQRIRRSVLKGGVGREPTHHSPSTHLGYVRSDAKALLEHRVAAAAGVQAALDRARSELTMKRAEGSPTPPQNDALIAHCADPHHSPITGAPCTTGYFLFLDCLDCDNAISVDRLLPRQIAALEVVEQLRDVTGAQWDDRYRKRALMLRALVERSTPAERERAASEVASFKPLIIAALRHETPEGYEHFLDARA